MEELLEEVLEQPEKDGPRLVYADWLSERGDPRGEFIAVQCELARKFEFQLVAREQQLLREHGARWMAELGLPPRPRAVPGAIPQVVFRRGFAERIEVEVGELARIDVARMPVRHVVIAGVRDGNIGELVALPAIRGVRSVGIRNAHLKPRNVRQLGEAPLVVAAEELAFHHGHLSDVSELATIELPQLRALHLDDAYMQNVYVLGRASWLPQLRSLRIRDTHRFALRHLVGARGLASLVELRIETNMHVAELVELASATHFAALVHLEVAIGYSDDSAVQAFARAKGFARLERFVVRGKLSEDLVASLRARWGERLTIA